MRNAFGITALGITAAGIVALGACAHRTAPPPMENTATRATGSLADALTREIGAGRAVAIVPGDDGLRAISSDGARQRVLVAAPVAWAVVDQRSNVVWFGTSARTAIDAIDLDAPAADPPPVIAIATGVPDGRNMEMVGPVVYGVVYPDASSMAESPGMAWDLGDKFTTSSSSNMNATSLLLGIVATPELSGSSGYLRDEDWPTQIAAAKLPGREFVIGLLARKDHRAPWVARPGETRVEGIDPANCEDPEDCGRAEPIAGTHYWRVMTANVMGDVRHISWHLYDTDAKKLVDGEWATWFTDAYVAPDHSAFLASGVVVGFDRGPLAATPATRAGLGGGWLGGDAIYDF
ncbi:MAG: hypothetical protein K8W52_35860 [Deltaproteobacteria bacterium]|nr:hypothetical protein [Deltaproteobacteria bacterium]